MRIFTNNETGKEYVLIQEPLLFNNYSLVNENELQQQKTAEFVFYKALHDNTDGSYFVLRSKDFFEKFTEKHD